MHFPSHIESELGIMTSASVNGPGSTPYSNYSTDPLSRLFLQHNHIRRP